MSEPMELPIRDEKVQSHMSGNWLPIDGFMEVHDNYTFERRGDVLVMTPRQTHQEELTPALIIARIKADRRRMGWEDDPPPVVIITEEKPEDIPQSRQLLSDADDMDKL